LGSASLLAPAVGFPDQVRRMLDLVPGARMVLDPFCGSGVLNPKCIKMQSECKQLGPTLHHTRLDSRCCHDRSIGPGNLDARQLEYLELPPSHQVLFGSKHTLKTALNQNHVKSFIRPHHNPFCTNYYSVFFNSFRGSWPLDVTLFRSLTSVELCAVSRCMGTLTPEVGYLCFLPPL